MWKRFSRSPVKEIIGSFCSDILNYCKKDFQEEHLQRLMEVFFNKVYNYNEKDFREV